MRVSAVSDKISDAVSESFGFARTGASQDE